MRVVHSSHPRLFNLRDALDNTIACNLHDDVAEWLASLINTTGTPAPAKEAATDILGTPTTPEQRAAFAEKWPPPTISEQAAANPTPDAATHPAVVAWNSIRVQYPAPKMEHVIAAGDALAAALVESERQKEEGDAEYRTLHNMLVGAEQDHRRNYDNMKARAERVVREYAKECGPWCADTGKQASRGICFQHGERCLIQNAPSFAAYATRYRTERDEARASMDRNAAQAVAFGEESAREKSRADLAEAARDAVVRERDALRKEIESEKDHSDRILLDLANIESNTGCQWSKSVARRMANDITRRRAARDGASDAP